MDDEDGGWIIGADEEVVVVGGSHQGLKHGIPDEHNGLLIAAAPDLLDAAKRAYAYFELLAAKKAAETGETDIQKCLEPEGVLLRDVLERAERPELPSPSA
jgi:hypothetical protein